MISRGFSLAEMLLVVVIVGLVAAIAAPSLTNSDAGKLDLAANEVANVIRFARSESIRTGNPHGISAETSSQRVRLYLRGLFGLPEYTVRNPVDKKLYDLKFDTDPNLSDVAIASVAIDFVGLGPSTLLGFNAEGVPKYQNGSTIHLLNSAEIRLGLGNDERIVIVAPTTGRVTVQ